VWGLIRTLPQITTYGIDAIRDAALWYYAFFAFAVMALVHRRPSLPEEWLHRYVGFLPWLLLWFPIAIVLDRVMAGGPWIPDSDVYVFTHKPADAAIHTAVALAVLWLFPTIVGSPRRRLVLMAMCVVVLCVALTQNRGGIVAAAAGLGVGWLFMAHRVRAALEVLAIVAVLLVFGWALDLRIAGERDVSVGQIMDNVLSLAGKPGDPKLEGTVEWRGELWDRVLQETIARDRLAFGWGFGPNLGDEGFGGAGGGLLRSPHNSHLNLLARMGILGSAMWMALWVAWGFAMYHARHSFERRRDDVGRGLVTVCMVGVTASIVNAYFDPALEGPHSSVLLWTLTGLGLALAAQAHGWGGRIRRPATVDATSQE
jgi:O-antigen ligase